MEAAENRSGGVQQARAAAHDGRRDRQGGGGRGRARQGGKSATTRTAAVSPASSISANESASAVSSLVPGVLVSSSSRTAAEAKGSAGAGRADGGGGGAIRSRSGRAGRGGDRSGRGRQHHRRHQQFRQEGKVGPRRPAAAPGPPPQVFTSNFTAMHAKCRAAKYKVHAPGCSCSKMKSARGKLKLPESESSSSTAETADASSSSSSAPEPKVASAALHSSLDGLVVLPDVRYVPALYLCLQTDAGTFSEDPKAAELKVKGEMFSAPGSGSGSCLGTAPPFKLSCAQCLLRHEPNGFVCVSSPSLKTVEVTRDLARAATKAKGDKGIDLHADHAHYVCAIPRRVLWDCRVAKTREQTSAATRSVVERMRSQGVPVGEHEHDRSKKQHSFDLGHHLSSLLHITRRDADAETAYWLVMLELKRSAVSSPSSSAKSGGDEEKRFRWTLDLPGGKRHLGESSFDGAVRETEEEISLAIDETWLVGDEPRRGKSAKEDGNVYYMLRPPADVMMKELESNPFWHEEGFCREPPTRVGEERESEGKKEKASS